MDSYSVSWEGYLKIPYEGRYMFNITAYGGIWFYLDGELVSHATGCDSINKIIRSIDLKGKYYLFKILYSKLPGKNGIIGEWLDIESKSFFLPFDNYIFTPSYGYIEYTYTDATYFLNKVIDINNPIFHPSQIINSIKINPSLPPGLHIDNETGAITGAASSSSLLNKRQTYTITIEFSSLLGLYETKIHITVRSHITPSGIYLIDLKDGSVLGSDVILGERYFLSLRTMIGFPYLFSVDNLPVNWEFSEESSILSGIISKDFNNNPLIVTVMGEDYTFSTEYIYFNVTNTCSDDKSRFIFSFVCDLISSSILFALSNSEGEVFSYIGYFYDVYYTSSDCIKEDEYTARSYAFPNGLYTISSYKNGVISNQIITELTSYTITYSFDLRELPPNFTYPLNSILYRNEFSSIAPIVYNYIGTCYINKDPPNGLIFDSNTGIISGKVLETVIDEEYIVYCINANGSLSQNFTITSMKYDRQTYCELEGNVYLTITITTILSNCIKYVLYYPNGDILFEINSVDLPSQITETYNFCVIQGVYSAIREDTCVMSLGWGKSTIALNANGIIIGNWTINANEKIKTDIIDCIIIIF